MNKWATWGFVCIGLTAAATGTYFAVSRFAAAQVDSTSEQSRAIDMAVRSSLNDPSSARVDGVRTSQNAEGVTFACGTVNAKNALGGYAGKTPFMGMFSRGKDGVSPMRFIVIKIGGKASDSIAIIQQCAEQGMALQP